MGFFVYQDLRNDEEDQKNGNLRNGIVPEPEEAAAEIEHSEREEVSEEEKESEGEKRAEEQDPGVRDEGRWIFPVATTQPDSQSAKAEGDKECGVENAGNHGPLCPERGLEYFSSMFGRIGKDFVDRSQGEGREDIASFTQELFVGIAPVILPLAFAFFLEPELTFPVEGFGLRQVETLGGGA